MILHPRPEGPERSSSTSWWLVTGVAVVVGVAMAVGVFFVIRPDGPGPEPEPRPKPAPSTVSSTAVTTTTVADSTTAPLPTSPPPLPVQTTASLPPPPPPTAPPLPTRAGPASCGLTDAEASNVLATTANADESTIDATLLEQWVTIVSSKFIGADPAEEPGAQSYTMTMICQDHFTRRRALEAEGEPALLLRSQNFPVFSRDGVWVTIVGRGSATADGALAYCRSRGLGREVCQAKLISRTRGPADTSRSP